MMFFKEIAPFLTHPLVLIGFVLLLGFGIHKSLIKSGIIPKLTKAEGSKILRLLLKYGYIIAIIVILLGFSLAFFQSFNKVNPNKTADLYISLVNKNNTKYDFEEPNDILKYPIETTTFVVDNPVDFYDCTILGNKKDTTILKLTAKIYILNLGQRTANKIWLKIFFDYCISTWIFGTDNWNVGDNKDLEKTEVYFNGKENFSIKPKSVIRSLGILFMNFPPIPRTYIAKYVIASNESIIKEREIKIIVKTDKVKPQFIENAKGIECYYEKDYRNALEHFGTALKMDPGNAAILFNQGTTNLLINNIDAAITSLTKACKVDNSKCEIWGNLGAAYFIKEDFNNAYKSIIKALEINPESEEDIKNLRYIEAIIKVLENPESEVAIKNLRYIESTMKYKKPVPNRRKIHWQFIK